jgi:hypothetical protein
MICTRGVGCLNAALLHLAYGTRPAITAHSSCGLEQRSSPSPCPGGGIVSTVPTKNLFADGSCQPMLIGMLL